nr:recombinase family protein [Chloroflexota bacterium]
MTRAAIYCRVSGKKQEYDGTSLGTQEAACVEHATAKGWTLVEPPTRETHTGYELWQRKKLDRLREMVRAGQVDVLLAYDPDRLARHQTHLGMLYDDCERVGARIAYVTVEDFDDTPIGRFLRNALAFAAEMEREKIKERTWRAIKSQARQGRRLAGPRPRYGFAWAAVEIDGRLRD